MEQVAFKLEEYAGHKFYVEFVSMLSFGYWFRIHTISGTQNVTIEHEGTIDEAQSEVIQSFKENLISNLKESYE
ncbi:hypothetical protein FAY30_26005 (plasmid) [Bacillus sp. S3]|uniref:hypothetical protein n=1 Tax=Bacillus sp. S3 TaxID=486398 RepID=UPI0011889628|nr:hypothetical protein [Bacillus sp. S3]QCJ45409.1 hypothetical protein FAY30_26005 [Bacillus sp. S3]